MFNRDNIADAKLQFSEKRYVIIDNVPELKIYKSIV